MIELELLIEIELIEIELHNRDSDSNIFKGRKKEDGYINTKENFPDLIQEENVNKNANEGSIWLNAIKIKKEEHKKNEYIINTNDSQYWRGGKWIGDMILRHKPSSKAQPSKATQSKATQSKATQPKAQNNSVSNYNT